MSFNLREISREDLPVINKWRNDKELINLLGNNFLYIAVEVDEKWYENYLSNRHNAIRLAILADNDKKIIGTVQLTNIHPVNKSAEYSILIGEKDYWSKGAGLFATKEILIHGFRNLNLHRIYLFVLAYNERAIYMYEKAGFQREGVSRGAIYKNGSYHDLICMSILSTDNIIQKI